MIEFLLYMILGMLWVLSGLFVAFLMYTVDRDTESSPSKRWIIFYKSYILSFLLVLVVVLLGPISLLIGISAMASLCRRK